MKTTLFSLATLASSLGLGMVPLPATAMAVQWSGNNHYYEYVSGQFNFDQAKTAAETSIFNGINGHLVTVTSIGEETFILNNLFPSDRPNYWLGASDEEEEGLWQWVSGPETGQVFWQLGGSPEFNQGNHNNWATGEPNNFGFRGEDFAVGNWVEAGQWNDWGGQQRAGYVVEYSQPVPTPALLPGLLGLGLAAFKRRRGNIEAEKLL